MDVAFATAGVDPAERLTAWRDLVSRVFLPLTITPQPGSGGPRQFDGSVAGDDWGGLRVWRVRATPMSAVRTPRHIRFTTCDDYLLALHIAGTARAVQDGRRVALGPGDFALFDPTRPYSITFAGAGTFEHVIYQMPRASLDARRLPGDSTALAVRAASSAGRLVSPYLRALAQPGGDPPGQAFIDAGLDLAASALRAAADPAGRHDVRQRSLAAEVRRYALANLADPGLCPEAAARASYISVRQLHRLFARDGTSFGAWVREQRLRRCRDDLASPRLSDLGIAEIAASWGFSSPAHFARAFRARYGSTPTEVSHGRR